MILYHGSDMEVRFPKIIKSTRGKDFGPAFYVTPIKEQAERMAKRKQRMTRVNAIVSVYEFNESLLSSLSEKTLLLGINMILWKARSRMITSGKRSCSCSMGLSKKKTLWRG